MILRLSLDLPEDLTYIRTTRLLSRCLLEDIKVQKSTIDDVESIVSELCSNVIRHAKSKEDHYLVVLEYFKPKIVITVKDSGTGFSLDDVPPVGSPRPDGDDGVRIGGFGMSILEGLADKLDVTTTDPHGTTVRAEKNLYYETRADAKLAEGLDKDKATANVSKD